MKNFIIKNWQIIIPEIILLIVFGLFYGKFGHAVIDSYREIYIPQQILQGNCLYKNIFVIYPPLSYVINAFLLKIFPFGLQTLLVSGCITSFGILFFTDKITRIFIDKFYSLSINIFIISGLILSANVFNGIFPYSYGILYGILFALSSVYYALNNKYSLAYLFCSLALLCKYEFLLLLPLLVLWTKKDNLLKNFICSILPILVTFGILIIQGLRLDDIKTAVNIIDMMSHSKILYWFYSAMGLTFRFELVPIYINNFIKFFIPINFNNWQAIIIWSLPVITLCGLVKYRQLKNKEKFFVVTTIIISIKVFFATTLQSYSVYFLPFIIISLFIVSPKKLRKLLFVLFIFWSLIIGFFNIQGLLTKKTSFPKVTEFIINNTNKTDRVLVYPECLSINILSNRISDHKFYSLIPLYVETFGEDLIIKRFELTKPEYIVTNNYDTSAYYYKEFGKDYAINILNWIEQNYTLVETINDGLDFKIYKINN